MRISAYPDPNRKRNRLKHFDYSTDGSYFVTVCTQNREHFFGEIRDKKMIPNACGKTTQKCWHEIPDHFPHARIDEFVVMPNHVHGIIWIENEIKNHNHSVGNKNFCSLPRIQRESQNKISWQTKLSRSLSSIIRGFKIGVTKWCRDNEPKKSFAWQKSFHDRIIRNDEELNRIREYISLNPMNWKNDRNNLPPSAGKLLK